MFLWRTAEPSCQRVRLPAGGLAASVAESMKQCLVLRHVNFEDLGSLAAPLRRRGYKVRYVDTPIEALGLGEAINADLLIVLGGPISVNDHEAYPWLTTELQAIAGRLASRRPTLGICLGAQLMAASLGASVVKASAVEIGWGLIDLTEAGRTSPLAVLEGLPVLHWHGDRFELPDGAVSLASTKLCPHQAFSVGHHALAIQFHVEADPAKFENWLVANAADLHAYKLDPVELRRSALLYGASMTSASSRVISGWLEGL